MIPLGEQSVRGESHHHHAQNRLDDRFRQFLERQKSQRDPQERRAHQPSRAAQVDPSPVLDHDDQCDGDRDQHRGRSGYLHRHDECEQRHGDERFSKSEGRAHDGGGKQDQDHLNCDPVGWHHSSLHRTAED